MIEVFVEGLEFYAYHGVPDKEREIGHRFVVDFTMNVDSKAESTDKIGDTADYAVAAELVQSVAQAQSCWTIERLANNMAEALLKKFPHVQAVNLTVRKPLPPSPMIAESVGVTIELSR